MRQTRFRDRSAKDIAICAAMLALLVLRVFSIALLGAAIIYCGWAILSLLGIGGTMKWEHATAVATVCAIPAFALDKALDFLQKRIPD